MACDPDAPLHHLLDPEYWKPRLERLGAVPRHLVVTPRPDYGRPGIEVAELRLRAHDGERLQALLCRPCFGCQGDALLVEVCEAPCPEELDWGAVEEGAVEVLFRYPPGRRLEDRVLDVVRVFQAACSIEPGEGGPVSFGRRQGCGPADELVIVSRLHERGWLAGPPAGPDGEPESR